MTLKNLAGKASFHLARFLLFTARFVHIKMVYALCSIIVFAGSRLNWKRKHIALDNIKIVFPEKNPEERELLFRDSIRNMMKNYLEIAYIISRKNFAEKISQMAAATGLEHLDRLRDEEKGALLYTGHFGNFPLMIAWLAGKGYPVAAIYKEAENFPDGYFESILKKVNVTPLKYRSEATLTVSIIRALRDKKIVLIQNDQSHPQGIYINFFNHSVPSPAGPALLAKRVGVPIIPAYVFRDKNNFHHITILPELPLRQVDDHEKFMTVNTQMLLDWIAEILIRHPAEWLWLHNRWKRARKE